MSIKRTVKLLSLLLFANPQFTNPANILNNHIDTTIDTILSIKAGKGRDDKHYKTKIPLKSSFPKS